MSGSSTRKSRKRALMAYDPTPPACGNCKHFSPAQLPRKATTLQPALRFLPAHCTYGSFGLPHPHGVCDVWQGEDGETLA